MIIERIAIAMEQINHRFDRVENCVSEIVKHVNDISSSVCPPSGEITFAGQVRTTPENLKKAIGHSIALNMEELIVDIQFKQGIFMGIVPKAKERIKKLLSESQIKYLKTLLEQHKRLDDALTKAENSNRHIRATSERLETNALKQMDKITKSADDKVKQGIQQAQEAAIKQEKQIVKAVGSFTEALKEMETCKAKISNIIKVKKPNSKPFSMRNYGT